MSTRNIYPIKPNEVSEMKFFAIPEEMIEVVNDLIIKSWDGHSAILKQNAIVVKYLSKIGINNCKENRDKIFGSYELNFEEIYRKVGWEVYLNKGTYHYDTFFEFKKKK